MTSILFNTYPLAFNTLGGGEIQLLQTKQALKRLGTDVLLFDQWKPQLNSVDLVHFFSVFGGSQVFCEFVKREGLPLVISPVLYPIENLDQYPMEEIKNLLDLADLILPNSSTEIQLLAEVFDQPQAKFRVVYNGVVGDFLDGPKVEGRLFRDHFNIRGEFLLNVANVEPRKNQLAIAKAIANTDLQLIILGNIRDHEYFNRVMDVGKENVRFLGYLPNESALLKSAYEACSLFVLPSLLETPGLAALEAGALGAKILITEVGSTREYFGEYVDYIDPHNENEILDRIRRALLKSYPHGLAQRICSRFTWENAAKATLDAYDAVL